MNGWELRLHPESSDGADVSRALLITFDNVKAMAIYEDLIASIAAADPVYDGHAVSLIENFEWPISDQSILNLGYRTVQKLRFFPPNAVVDVVSVGEIKIDWIQIEDDGDLAG